MYNARDAKTAAEGYQMLDTNIAILLAKPLDKKREHAAEAATQAENWGYTSDRSA